MSFAKKLGNKYGKKLVDTATKTGRCCKNCFKKSSSKNYRSYRDLIGNKITDKITLIGKPKEKEKEKTKEIEEIYIPPEKRQQIIDDLILF